MAGTKFCKFCEKVIPKEAEVCPQCGKRIGSKALWQGLFTILVILSCFIGSIIYFVSWMAPLPPPKWTESGAKSVADDSIKRELKDPASYNAITRKVLWHDSRTGRFLIHVVFDAAGPAGAQERECRIVAVKYGPRGGYSSHLHRCELDQEIYSSDIDSMIPK